MANKQVTVDEALAVEDNSAVIEPLDIKTMISQEVAKSLESLIPSLVTALAQTQVNNHIPAPSPTVMIGGPNAESKAEYKKHYRLDGTIDGKFQKINFVEMQRDGATNPFERDDRGEFPYLVKGEWLNVKGDHFFAVDDNDVYQVEYLIDKGYRFYEDTGGPELRCAVTSCGKTFSSYDVLKAHMKATHGVG
jgi:hypothetical protein